MYLCVCVWVRVQKIVRRIKNYNNCHNNSTGGKKRQSSGWEHKHTAQCQIKHYPIPKGSYRQLIYVDYNLSGDMRIQDGHFGALSWRIKQIIGLSRRNTKEGSHETGTKRQRQHGTFWRSITYHTILCFYLYSCHGRPNTPHAARHMPHGSFSPRPTFSLLAEEKSEKVNKQNEQMDWRGEQEFPGISRVREEEKKGNSAGNGNGMECSQELQTRSTISTLTRPFKRCAQLLLLSQLQLSERYR